LEEDIRRSKKGRLDLLSTGFIFHRHVERQGLMGNGVEFDVDEDKNQGGPGFISLDVIFSGLSFLFGLES
jgi:hypothetical protein